MSKVAELAYDIQELFIDGMGAKQIATELDCPVELVLQVLNEFGVEDSDTDYPTDEIYSPYYGA
jgi:orotate phosphoribosyltransferase-like protein